MQFCLLHIEYSEARLSCYEAVDLSFLDILNSTGILNLVWTDVQSLNTSALISEESSDEPISEVTEPKGLSELLSRNISRIVDTLIIQIGSSYGEVYSLNFPFSDIKKIKQIINPEIEDLLPFDINIPEYNIAIDVEEKSSSNNAARILLLKKELIKDLIDDIQYEGLISPLFLYQPFVTESILKNLPHTPFICLEYNRSNSYLYMRSDDGTFAIRPLVLTNEVNTLQELLVAHIGQSENQNLKKLLIINKTTDDLELLFSGSNWDRTIINPLEFISQLPELETDLYGTLASSNIGALAVAGELHGIEKLDDTNLKEIKLFNIRDGEFRYRAPFSDFKESLFAEIVPFSLTVIFLLFFVILGFLTPNKEISLLDKKAKELLSIEAPELASNIGKPLDILANEIVNLEGQIGGLTTMRSLSPFDWLYKLSIGLKADISLSLETLSITSTGITFRGTVPDYPTSGRLDGMMKSMLKENQGLICKAEANSEQGSSTQKVSITGVIELCQ